MFENVGSAGQVEEDLSWLGPEPDRPPEDLLVVLREREAEEHERWKAALDPWSRFEVETGLRAVAEHGFVLPPAVPVSLEERAVAAQERLAEADRAARSSGAARTLALVAAYEASMRDLAD